MQAFEARDALLAEAHNGERRELAAAPLEDVLHIPPELRHHEIRVVECLAAVVILREPPHVLHQLQNLHLPELK